MPHERAHAKLNLALSVGGPIPSGEPFEGFHPIASWMVPLDLADDVIVERAATTSHDIRWHDGTPAAWAIENDLAVRAHAAMEAAVGRSLPASIRVRKSIPDGGGLGGGSSDAAAVLRGLNRAFEIGRTADELRTIGHTIGSDVPFFVSDPPAAAFVFGVGDRIVPLAPDRDAAASGPRRALLVFPPFGCPTGEVYRAFDGRPGAPADEDRVRALAAAPLDPGALFNDLAAPATSVRPELSRRDELSKADGVPVHVTGSGSTLFAIEPADDAGAIDRIAAAVPAGWSTRRVSLLAV